MLEPASGALRDGCRITLADGRNPRAWLAILMIFDLGKPAGGQSLHVLVVVVGKSALRPLLNAASVTNDLVDFWCAQDHRLPGNRTVRTIEVLAGDPGGNVTVTAGGLIRTATAPTFPNVCSAVQSWCDRINSDPDAAGVLHWIGHGECRMREGGEFQVLFTEDEDAGKPLGINWHLTLHGINNRTAPRPVYCFIDSCRKVSGEGAAFYPAAFQTRINQTSRNATTLFSAAPDQAALWEDALHSKGPVFDAGFKGGPLGTRAMIKGLETLGAQYRLNRPRYKIVMANVGDGSEHLIERWTKKLGAPIPPTALGKSRSVDVIMGRHDELLMTDLAESVIDVNAPTGSSWSNGSSCKLTNGSAKALDGVYAHDRFEFLATRGQYVLELTESGTTSSRVETFIYPSERI